MTNTKDQATPLFIQKLRRVTRSPYFYIILLALCCVATAVSQYLDFLSSPDTPAKEGAAGTVVLVAALLMVAVLTVILFASNDTFDTTVPFLLLTVLVSSCYDSFSLFAPFWWAAIPAALALVFHFVRYRGRFSIGNSLAPLVAVSVAVTLGGCACLSAAEYFTAANAYYVAGLGFGMVGLYLLLRASAAKKSARELCGTLLFGLYLAGIYAAFFTLLFYAVRAPWIVIDLREKGHLLLFSIDNRNVYATFLLLGLPAPFYYAVKKNGWHLAVALVFLLSLLLTGSRGGLLMGAVLFVLCVIYLMRRDRAHRRRNLILLAILAVLALAASGLFLKFYASRLEGGLIKGDEPRVQLLLRAIDDFLSHPIFGVGLGYRGNADIYNPKTFAMNWYHMMIPQIVAGLGLVGVAAWGFLLWRRGKLILRCPDALSRALALSYIGLLLMSQVNPGEFCPMPYALIAVMIFLSLELSLEERVSERKNTAERALTALLSNALFEGKVPPPKTDYRAVLDLANAHMVFGVASEGMSGLREDAVPTDVLHEWQDLTILLWQQNEALALERRALIAFCKDSGIPAVILKGDAVAALYPTPDLRVAGDIDILISPDDIPAVSAYLVKNGFTPTTKEGEHHDVFEKGRVKFEVHRAVSGIPDGEAGETVSAYLADILTTATTTRIGDDLIPIPDDTHQALVLLLHMQQHLREGGLGLRQLLDFALFLQSISSKDTTKEISHMLHQVGLYHFAATLALACHRHLGLPSGAICFAGADEALADALFADMMSSGNFGRGSADYAGSAIVTLHRDEKRGALGNALQNIADKCKREWSAAERHPVLLLFLVPFWTLRRILKKGGVRPQMLAAADKRGKLYDRLKLFKKEP